jgi:hypothetical protein
LRAGKKQSHPAFETDHDAFGDEVNDCAGSHRPRDQRNDGWEKTLTGLPKEMYEFWDRRLRPLGYKLKVQIVDWPDGMPGDVGITLKWV